MNQREQNASEEDSQAERLSFLLFFFFLGGGCWREMKTGGLREREVKAVLIETWPH